MLSFIRANSNQESFATVDQFGHIRAIKEGVVTITAHIQNTNLTAYCIVIVIVKVGAAEGNSIFVSALNLLRFSFFLWNVPFDSFSTKL
ncbi:Ig-like domain-containing protein [Lysinibacillus xylanilyticus]|uniref:Ig-like domain-containing protein n=1 Tax=Lysinibacillus xylanilyticus TaxID=582475 RepID=UPI003D08DFD7